MPLSVLLVLVIGGIAGIALLLHVSGRSQRLVMSAEDARTAWHRHLPDDEIAEVIPSGSGHAALILTSQGPGLVWAFGADTVARRLIDYDLFETRNGLRVMFRDFTAPRVDIRLSASERDHWRDVMRAS